MKNPFKSFNLPSAAPRKQHFDLSQNHLTTNDFSQLSPCYYRDLVPKDHFEITTKIACYTAPLVVPPIASAHIHTRAFFVPYRIVMKYFNEWITETQVNDGSSVQNVSIPRFSSDTLIDMFVHYMTAFGSTGSSGDLCKETQDNQGAVEFDSDVVVMSGVNNPIVSFDFTPLGRRVFKILRSLGYSWNWDNAQTIYFNALPLLCFFKAYLDYYEPAQTAVASPINSLLTTQYDYIGSAFISYILLYDCLTHCLLCYPNDYFTSAWKFPNKVANGDDINARSSFGTDFAPTSGSANYSDRMAVVVDENSTNLRRYSQDNLIARISQYGLNLLRSVDNWVRRNNYAGAARVTDAILARYGVKVPDATLDRTEFIGFDDTPIRWEMITNTTANSSPDLALGAFGAKGYADSQPKTFTYDAKEHGMLLILSSIIPDAMYYHGADKTTLQTDPLEFFQPEFERLGTSPIRLPEIYADSHNSSYGTDISSQELNNIGYDVNGVFGYAPNYANYKVPHDLITGDFNVPTLQDPLSSWHFGREFFPRGRVYQGEQLNAFTPLNILYYSDFVSQYNRIFNVTDNSADHFITIFSFKVDAQRPMLSISDSIPLDGSGEDVNLQPNGTRMS